MLPDGDGLLLLQHVRRSQPNCRVIITTGVSDPERIKSVSQHAPGLILLKPIDLYQLLNFLDSPATP